MEPLRPEDPRQVGSYLVQARIGSGGMGEVFLGRSPGGRAVAIKVIHAALANDPEFRARFRREVDAAKAVTGAFTAPVVDADPEAAQPWLATAFLPGISLDDAVAGFGPWPPPPVYLLGAGLAEALVSIHRAAVVHRDLKPSNILLTRDGPRVIDFGIARAAEAATITQTGMAVGSPSYMAPEQATGGETGPPGDVFALGAVLTYAATGTAPFGGGSIPQLVYRIVHEQPNLDAIADPGLRALVAACLDKDPSRRPTAVQLLGHLAQPARPPAVPHPPYAAPAPPPPAGWPTPLPPPPMAGPAVAGPAMAPARVASPQGIGWLPPPIAAAVAQRAGAALPQPATVPSRGGPSRRALIIGGAAAAATLAVAGTGALLWQNRPRSPILWSFDPPEFLGEGPMLAGNTVFVTGQETFALDPRDGKVRWRYSDRISRNSLPIVQDGRVFIYDGGSLNALNLATGDTAWTEPVKTFALAPIPTVMNGIAGMTASRETGDYGLYAFDAATGKDRWRYELEEIPQTNAAGKDGVFYVGSGRELLYAVDATGRLRWQQPAGDKIISTPAVAGGLVIVITQNYRVIAFDAATGKPRWKNTSGAISNSGLTQDPVPVIVAGIVYVRGVGGVIRALDVATGRERWSFAAGDKAAAPTITNGSLFIHDGKSTLYAIETATGKARWTHHFETAPGARPSLMNNTLYAGATDGVFGFDPPTGRITFRLDKTDFSADAWLYIETLVAWNGVLYCAMGSKTIAALRT
jgi:outer membrane protein assembly factor BamB